MSKFSVVAALDRDIVAKEEPRMPDGRYHPSSFWGCDRKAIYTVRGTPETNPPDLKAMRRFKIGHKLHEVVQQAITDSGGAEQAYDEFEVEIDALNISGHGDMLVEVTPDFWIVVEIKSIRKNGFRYIPKDDHIQQAQLYALGARDYGVLVSVGKDEDGADQYREIPPLGDKFKGILLVYFEKEDLDTAEYWIEYNEDWRIAIEQRVADLDQYRNDPESLPRRLPMKNGKLPTFPCDYCPFKTRCLEDPLVVLPGDPVDRSW